MKSIKDKQIKANDKFHGKKNAGFVNSGFVKTCDELVIGHGNIQLSSPVRVGSHPLVHHFYPIGKGSEYFSIVLCVQ